MNAGRALTPDPLSQVIGASLIRAEQAVRAVRPGGLELHERRSLQSSLYRSKTILALLNQALAQAEAMESQTGTDDHE